MAEVRDFISATPDKGYTYFFNFNNAGRFGHVVSRFTF